MKLQDILGKVRRKAVVGMSLLSLAGCIERGNLLFDVDIEGQRVRYFDSVKFSFSNYGLSDILEVYSPEDKERLSKLFVDSDEDGNIGKNSFDRYEVYDQDGKRVVYESSNVTDKNGRRYSGIDDISEKALEISKVRLEEATREYQAFKQKIKEKISQEL